MTTNSQYIVQKLWNYCNILRDDGMSYGDYVEQLTYLLFLKMAHERTQPPYNQPSRIPRDYDWESLLRRDGDELETHYRHHRRPRQRHFTKRQMRHCELINVKATLTSCLDESYNYYRQQQRRTMTKEESL